MYFPSPVRSRPSLSTVILKQTKPLVNLLWDMESYRQATCTIKSLNCKMMKYYCKKIFEESKFEAKNPIILGSLLFCPAVHTWLYRLKQQINKIKALKYNTPSPKRNGHSQWFTYILKRFRGQIPENTLTVTGSGKNKTKKCKYSIWNC